MNRVKTISLLACCFIGVVRALQANKHEDGHILPATTVIAWDFHEVLGKRDMRATLASIAQATPTLARLIAALCYESMIASVRGNTSRGYRLITGISERLKVNHVTAEDFKDILDEYDPSLWPVLLSIYSEYRPMPGMLEIINQLHRLGYEQRIATNMSGAEFEEIKKRNAELFVHFKEGLMVKNCIQEPHFPRKPLVGYFQRLYELIMADRATYTAEPLMSILFIDDKCKNVTGAALFNELDDQMVTMKALHFTSVQKLCNDLEGLLGKPFITNL